MNRNEQIKQSAELGKQAVTMARQVARTVSVEVTRQAKIARPIVEDVSRTAWTELQRQTAAAKPIVKEAARRGIAAAKDGSRQACNVLQAAALKNAPAVCQWARNARWLRTVGLAGAVLLAVVALFAGVRAVAPVGRDAVVDARESDVSPLPQPVVADATPTDDAVIQPVAAPVEVSPPPEPSQNTVRAQREAELAQLRQQAQIELQNAAAEYEYAVAQWNAEVAACQQGGLPPGYTPQQMGRFAAMGVRLQPRQPNQALLYAAQQAEQRYLQARDNCQRLAHAQ